MLKYEKKSHSKTQGEASSKKLLYKIQSLLPNVHILHTDALERYVLNEGLSSGHTGEQHSINTAATCSPLHLPPPPHGS